MSGESFDDLFDQSQRDPSNKFVHGVARRNTRPGTYLNTQSAFVRAAYIKEFLRRTGIDLSKSFKPFYQHIKWRPRHEAYAKKLPVPEMMLTPYGVAVQQFIEDPFNTVLANLPAQQLFRQGSPMRTASVEPPVKGNMVAYRTFLHIHDFMKAHGYYLPTYFKFGHCDVNKHSTHLKFFRGQPVPQIFLQPNVDRLEDVVPSSPPN